MKKIIIYCMAIITVGYASFSRAANIDLEGEKQQKSPTAFVVGNTRLPVVFEDEDCPEKLRAAIVDDLNLIYSHQDGFEKLPSSKNKTVRFCGKDRQFKHYVRFSKNNYRPKQLRGLFGGLLEVDEQESLFIPQKMSALYGVALNRKQNNNEIYSKLNDFLSMLNNASVSNLTDEAVLALFCIDERMKPDEDDFVEEFVNEFGKYKYRQPSILQIDHPKNDKTLPEQELSEFSFFAYIYQINQESGKFSPGYLAVYNESLGWRIFLPYL